MVEVTLTSHELFMASGIGMMRRIVSLQKGLKDKHGYDGSEAWDIDIEGACGECAFAKAMNLYWDGSINRFSSGGDVGNSYQIRMSKRHNNNLIVRPGDADEKQYVFVTGHSGKYRVHGWTWGRDAKQECWLEAKAGREPAYFMPQWELRALEELTRKEL